MLEDAKQFFWENNAVLSNPIASMLPAQYELQTMEAPKDYDIRTNVIGFQGIVHLGLLKMKDLPIF